MQYAIVAVVILAIVALIALPMITDNQARIERERTEQAYARVQLAHANNQAWLYFSAAMYPWFVTVIATAFGAALLLAIVLLILVLVRSRAPRPIYVIADTRRDALERLGSYGYLPERPEQIIVPVREEAWAEYR